MDFRSYIKNLLIEATIDSEEYQDILLAPEPLSVFQKAFTDPTYDPVNNYEVLEFIGDGIFDAVYSQYVPKRFGDELQKIVSKKGTNEGGLSKVKRYLKQGKFQAELALNLDMWKYVLADEKTKDTNRNKTLENVMEAFIGALAENIDRYIYDGFGYMFAKRFLIKQMEGMDIQISDENLDDTVTRLNELYKGNINNLRWGDAVYEYTQLFLPIIPNLNSIPPGYKKGDTVFIKSGNTVYYFDGKKWVLPRDIPLGEKPVAYNIYGAINPRDEEYKDKFQYMQWVSVYGKPRGYNQIIGQGISFIQKSAKKIAAGNALNYLKTNFRLEPKKKVAI